MDEKVVKPVEGVICRTCGLVVHEQGAIRCPRCYGSLLAPSGCSGNCTKCLMKSKSCGH